MQNFPVANFYSVSTGQDQMCVNYMEGIPESGTLTENCRQIREINYSTRNNDFC